MKFKNFQPLFDEIVQPTTYQSLKNQQSKKFQNFITAIQYKNFQRYDEIVQQQPLHHRQHQHLPPKHIQLLTPEQRPFPTPEQRPFPTPEPFHLMFDVYHKINDRVV